MGLSKSTLSARSVKERLDRSEFGEALIDMDESHTCLKRYDLRGSSDGLMFNADQETGRLKSVPSHPCVQSYEKIFVENETLYIQMDFDKKGYRGTLNDYVINSKLTQAARDLFMSDMAEGLQHLHKYNIVHRDIRPENVLVFDDPRGVPRCKLALYGVGCFKDISDPNAEPHYDQTPPAAKYFLAEEVLKGRYTKLYDIFSLGVVFCSLHFKELSRVGSRLYLAPTLNGMKPFYKGSQQEIIQRVVQKIGGQRLTRIIIAMLNKNYERRLDARNVTIDLNRRRRKQLLVVAVVFLLLSVVNYFRPEVIIGIAAVMVLIWMVKGHWSTLLYNQLYNYAF